MEKPLLKKVVHSHFSQINYMNLVVPEGLIVSFVYWLKLLIEQLQNDMIDRKRGISMQ